MTDEQHMRHMRRALELARRGEGRVAPNPPVGCVLVKDGVIVGEGWHDRLGGLHAEAAALADATARGGENAARGATAYVTLSPCTTHGRQPPCADALIRAGVAEVIVAASDPNPGNSNGVDVLNAAGIPARAGMLREEAEYLARGFFKKMRRGLPWVTLKYAMTMDGKIAAAGGDSKWVSGEASRRVVQDMRSRHDAVLAGIGTALADDPILNVRDPVWTVRGGAALHKQPARIIVDSRCRMSPDAAMIVLRNLHGDSHSGKIIVARAAGPGKAAEKRAVALRDAGAEVWEFESADRKVPLRPLLARMGDAGMHMVMTECGGTLAAALLRERLADEAVAFIAPKLIGGGDAPGPVGFMGLTRMREALPLRMKKCRRVGKDVMITGIFEHTGE